jgi:apolipoprotein D and lipocalin family protein
MKKILLVLLAVVLTGCASTQPRLKTVERLDLNRFMGPWYVIACIPVFIEAKAFNEVEEYALRADGSIDTVLTFNQGSFDGPQKRYNPRGFVVDKINNSTWKMQFVWPFKAEYLVTYINDDYSQTIVSRNKRDYVWVMARTPQIPAHDYAQLLKIVQEQGYDLKRIRRVPQQEASTP